MKKLASLLLPALLGLASVVYAADEAAKKDTAEVPEPMRVESEHMVKIAGRAIEYTATAALAIPTKKKKIIAR